ncbi:uncharacterized, partial [Tachysurus ichikawai]
GEQGAERDAFSEPPHAFLREDSGLVKELGNGMQRQAYLSRKNLGQVANSVYDIAFHLFLQALTDGCLIRQRERVTPLGPPALGTPESVPLARWHDEGYRDEVLTKMIGPR